MNKFELYTFVKGLQSYQSRSWMAFQFYQLDDVSKKLLLAELKRRVEVLS